MKVGILTRIMKEKSFDEALAYFSGIGYETITFGSGGLENRPTEHCKRYG